MQLATRPKPRSRRIALSDLRPRPGHPYGMSPRILKSLLENIGRGGLYPPLIVRPHARLEGKFEILDGHRRADVLRRLGADRARCEVWPVNEDEAELYAFTLNHLRGRAESKRRARQLRRIIRRLGATEARKLLALTPAAMRQQLCALQRPQEAGGGVRPLELRPVVFHLPPKDAKLLDRTLRQLAPAAKRRSEALLAVLRGAANSNSPKEQQEPCPI